ncbi:MAG TPA: acyl carrier protein [Kofleriaceae bacterium]|nr:acyl carrier protein [Kofleriaceae bacterium]
MTMTVTRMTESELRQALRAWILASTAKLEAFELTDQTALLETQIVSSLQLMELILFLEETLGRSIDVTTLAPGAFHSIDAITSTFFTPTSPTPTSPAAAGDTSEPPP